MAKFLLLFSLFFAVSCGLTPEKEQDGVYFAGEIVNPTSKHIILYKNDKVVDSAALDADNQFVFQLDKVDKGLHHFDHSPELQYVFLEPGDSLTLRLNTVAFDESLVFSGTNGDVNNFLVEIFLNYEDEEQYVYSLYKLPPLVFSNKVDSLRQLKLQELQDLLNTNSLSEDAYGMAKAAIDYSSFTYKEKYPFYHKKYTGEETIHKLDDKFYAYRKAIDKSNEDLIYFRPYYDFMIYHFGNLSYMSCAKDCGIQPHSPGYYLHLNKHKLHLIDSAITQEELRNNLFRSVAMDVLLIEHSASDDCIEFVKNFESLSTNEIHHEEVRNVLEGITNLQPDENIPHVVLFNHDNQQTSLKNVTGKGKSVVYFWSGTQKRHFRNVAKHIGRLQNKHKNTQFIGLCLQTSKRQWQEMIKESGLDAKNQYWSPDSDDLRNKLIIDGLNKCIITQDSLIEDGFAYLYGL